jgi:hypothetical protein
MSRRIISPKFYDFQDGCDLPQARIVFDVTLEGSARKLITVRSALLLLNHLELPLEVKLENTPTVYSRGECESKRSALVLRINVRSNFRIVKLYVVHSSGQM